MKVYIAGPMRGYDQYNFKAFDRMRDRLTDLGFEVVSPADIDREFIGPDYKTIKAWFETPGGSEAAMERDISYISKVDLMVALKGYEGSKGADVEIAYAKYRGIPVFYEHDFSKLLTFLDKKGALKLNVV